MKRFPHYTQLESMDCGPTCLRIVSAYYGRYYSLQSLRERCHISREGVSVLGICNAAEDIGLRSVTLKLTWHQLRSVAPLPCIVHWRQRHFVVVYKIRKKRGHWWVYLSDPAHGLLKYSEQAFLKAWCSTSVTVDMRQESELARGIEYEKLDIEELAGYAENSILSDDEQSERIGGSDDGEVECPAGTVVLLEPAPAFYRNGDDRPPALNFGYVLQYLKPYRNYLIQLVLAMLTASILSLFFPILTQSVVDKGIGTGNLSFVVTILIAQIILVLGQTANNLIRSWLLLHMTTRVSISLISDFLAKLMRLPIAFFDTKMVGDIIQRIGDHNRIQNFLTGSLLSITMAIVSFVIYGVIMGGYDMAILGIFLIGSALYIIWVLLFMKRRKALDYMRFQEAAANQNSIVQLIGGMQDIKLNNCEKQKRWEWERIQARLFHVSVKGLALGQTQEVGGLFIDQTKNVLISFLAASSVIDGRITLGMMVALQYIIGQLNAPISRFIQFVQATQDAKISLERLNEIQQRQDEESPEHPRIRDIPTDEAIVFRHVTFRYEGPNSPKALDDVDFVIPAHKVTAIVGTSGSGKTTLLKMILGFYAPTEGDVLLGDRSIARYSPSHWRRMCGTVMQEGYIFSDTIANNIGISDETPDMEKVRQAASMANIDSFVDELPLGYDTRIGADGHGLSTGQKQRLLIARAVYKNAHYLLLDEATNALDADNERTIMERLERLFARKTVVVVAHRLSTVKHADNIVVLDRGKVVEQGTHAELTEKRGYYYNLVKNQLELGI